MKNLRFTFFAVMLTIISPSVFAFKYECTVYYYSGLGGEKYTFNLDKYDSTYGERILKEKLKSQGKDPKSVSCAVN